MKCDEVQTLHGPYLDSELDAKTTLEIEQHLKACPACAHLFAEEEKLQARIMAGLRQGSRTAPVWEQVERSVVAAALTASRRGAPRGNSQSVPQPGVLWELGAQLRAGWQRSRWAWAGLAAVWVAILALNFSARELDAPLVAGQDAPSPSEMRLALKQKQLLMAELAVSSEPAPATKPKVAPPSPRSDRRNEALNT
jgi:anti-sigma factor RsiW